MDIIVCIKQVPGSSNVKVDPVTGVLIRDGVAGKMNPYDLYALELGLTLRERYGGSLKVVSMGPPAAMAVLNEAVWMGAAGGVLISDRRLGDKGRENISAREKREPAKNSRQRRRNG